MVRELDQVPVQRLLPSRKFEELGVPFRRDLVLIDVVRVQGHLVAGLLVVQPHTLERIRGMLPPGPTG